MKHNVLGDEKHGGTRVTKKKGQQSEATGGRGLQRRKYSRNYVVCRAYVMQNTNTSGRYQHETKWPLQRDNCRQTHTHTHSQT